ncbi:FtsX-like permease family protein [Pseudoflavitalea sp. X16]|uniref:ABC transporter permease n=1 Tax=Paraflavitalea devenefica TaxID=2716334 RepID=UPI00142376E1|nr:ABC transporter permease [Paraflavitalea devenefica]NII26503.1 FtsX-like permease family protein [Paraflavitalea devenefica]
MFKNYFKIALRNIVRHKIYSSLNIAGLAIGMACCILILLWVQHELSYDRFHANANQLYRLTANAGDFKAAVSPAGMGEGLQSQLPEIRAVVRLSKPFSGLFEAGAGRKFEEKNVFFADSNFLQEFSFPFLQGNAATALQRPNGIVITETLARKYFGQEEAMGKTIRLNNHDPFMVTGILANIPSNSHLQFDILLPMSFLAKTDEDLKRKRWGSFNFYTYLRLDKKTTTASLPGLTAKIQAIWHKSQGKEAKIDFHLQALTDIHLHSDMQIDVPGHGNMQYVRIFFLAAIFIIAVACINFMNLATARSANRAKEVGLRKVVGAARYQLVLQFLGESILLSFFSLCVAILIVWIALPGFNGLADKNLSLHLLEGKPIAGLLAIALLTGLVAGSYPALLLSGFAPVKVLKGKLRLGKGNLLFRNGLVVTQFVVAIVLLVGTAFVYRQLQFIKNKNLGFDKSNLLYIPMNGEIWSKQKALKSTLQQSPLTSDFSVISELPTALTSGTIDVTWEGKDPKSQVVIPSMDVDENFIDLFKMKMVAGRHFTTTFNGDSSNYVINETAMRLMNLNAGNAVGKPLSFGDRKGMIIGVVKDFNYKPLQYAIEPLVLRLNRWGGIVMVRTAPGNTEATIKALDKVYTSLNPAYPFSYTFLDKDLDNLYHSEQKMGSIFNLFAILAIFISCLGLYGLSAFMAEQRTKEIGVRKVLGASVTGIVYLLSTSFTKLILIAIAIAIPLSWYGIHQWLEGFAYHIPVNWIVFVVASLVVLVIAWLTVSYESVKAAITRPVVSLKSE